MSESSITYLFKPTSWLLSPLSLETGGGDDAGAYFNERETGREIQ